MAQSEFFSSVGDECQNATIQGLGKRSAFSKMSRFIMSSHPCKIQGTITQDIIGCMWLLIWEIDGEKFPASLFGERKVILLWSLLIYSIDSREWEAPGEMVMFFIPVCRCAMDWFFLGESQIYRFCVDIMALLLISYVTLSKFLNLPVYHFFICKIGMFLPVLPTSEGCGKAQNVRINLNIFKQEEDLKPTLYALCIYLVCTNLLH